MGNNNKFLDKEGYEKITSTMVVISSAYGMDHTDICC